MILSIDTTNPDLVTLTLLTSLQPIKHIFKTDRNLSEVLIPELKNFLAKQHVTLAQLTAVTAATAGEGHFSRIRTAVATANSLAYALKLAQPTIKPKYSQKPNITLSKRTYLTSFGR